ncbi:MAG: hypothetical protein ACLQRH_23695 [Acidimicrobiales bacterium]|jgi:hypothetical protein
MSKATRRLGGVALTTATVLGAWAATAAASPPSLSTIQAAATAAITLRVNDLNAAITKVNGSKDLGSDSAALAAYLSSDIGPLQALGQKIAGDTSVTTAKSDTASIYTNFRVLALVLPAAHLAATVDGIDVTALPNLTSLAAKAESRVNPSNQAVLQPLINDMNAQISAATTGTSGVASTVLGYTPAQWNANHDLLAPAHGAVQAAIANIAKARSDAQQIRAALASDKPAATTTSTTA